MDFELFGYRISIEKKALQEEKIPNDLRWALEVIQKYGAKIPPSQRKIESARRASKIKADKTREKVENAIRLLKLQGENITAYKVSKIAKVSYNTAKKYLWELGELEELINKI